MGLILSLDNSIHSFNRAGFVGLLDEYTGAAAGYSLRRLSVNTTNVVRVRRSSDNAEADFTADEITDGTLLAWVGNTASDNGHVTTWYDQAGSNDATQSTAANQPKIVDAGVLVTENGKPAVSFDGVDDYLQPSFKVSLQNIAMQFVYNYKTLANSGMALLLAELPQSYNGFNSSTETKNSFLGGGVAQQRPISKSTNQRSWSLYANSTSAAFYLDSVKVGADMPSNTDPPSSENLTIGSYFNGSVLANIKAQELIIYQTDQSSNRTTIETNINDYYNIYP